MNITIKAIPAGLHARLRDVAKRNGRSLNAEVTAILEKACMASPADRKDLLEQIRQTRAALGQTFDSQDLALYRKEGRA